jgi:hypothetical protein
MQNIMQTAIASFVVTGKPVLKGMDAKAWPKWGTSQTLMSINETGAALGRNSVNGTRCQWWQGWAK